MPAIAMSATATAITIHLLLFNRSRTPMFLWCCGAFVFEAFIGSRIHANFAYHYLSDDSRLDVTISKGSVHNRVFQMTEPHVGAFPRRDSGIDVIFLDTCN